MIDKIKLAVAAALVVAGIAGYYWLAASSILLRLLSLIAGVAAGAAVAWIADLLYGGRRGHAAAADYAALDREAGAVTAGADGVLALPVLADGERTDPDLRAVFAGLSLRHDRATLARATLEGVAYAIRAQLELIARGSAAVTELRVSGGDTRLATWNRIKADVTGLPVITIPGDASTAGVAMLAGLGIGVYRDPAEAIAQCVRPDPAIEPNRSMRDVYAASFRAHVALAASPVARRPAGP